MTNPNTQTNGYQVETGIPLPDLRGRTSNNRYPFSEMNVGDSFPLETSDIKELERVRTAASYYGIRNKPKKFAIRRIDPITKAYRCWRVA